MRVHGDWISITAKGRMLIRSIAIVFDRYLRQDRETKRYSQTI